ncbi:MAG TPA: zinc ribbon domain-containing protein [Candidatus Kapabacteria bacterium]|nr:zinc ribbon domain-containing protein [Candidatus Kapabacteria bacterium]
MPTYDYHCDSCGFEEEVFQRITDEALIICPNCKKETFHRVVSGGAGVLYKGEGWYVTDYSKRSSGGKEPPPKTETPTPSATPKTKGNSESKN